jgi:hypothetical protein
MSWRNYSFGHARRGRMFRNIPGKTITRKEGRPLTHLQHGEAVLQLVWHQPRNQRAASGFRRTPEQRETSKSASRFA